LVGQESDFFFFYHLSYQLQKLESRISEKVIRKAICPDNINQAYKKQVENRDERQDFYFPSKYVKDIRKKGGSNRQV
jgi:hypothetical protein